MNVMRKFSILCSCNLYQQHFTLTLGHMNTIISTCSFIHSNCVLVRTWIKFFLVWKRRIKVHYDCRDGKHNSELPIHPGESLTKICFWTEVECVSDKVTSSDANEAMAVAGQRYNRRGPGKFYEKMQTLPFIMRAAHCQYEHGPQKMTGKGWHRRSVITLGGGSPSRCADSTQCAEWKKNTFSTIPKIRQLNLKQTSRVLLALLECAWLSKCCLINDHCYVEWHMPLESEGGSSDSCKWLPWTQYKSRTWPSDMSPCTDGCTVPYDITTCMQILYTCISVNEGNI